MAEGGRDKMVQSRQVVQAPGLEHDEYAEEGAMAVERLWYMHPGQLQSSPQPQKEGKTELSTVRFCVGDHGLLVGNPII